MNKYPDLLTTIFERIGWEDPRGANRTGPYTRPRIPGPEDIGDKCPDQCKNKDLECENCFKGSHFIQAVL